MQRLFCIIILLALTGVSGNVVAQQTKTHSTKKSSGNSYKTYGAKNKCEGTAISSDQALETGNMNKPVWVQATVTDVCQAMGCWLTFSAKDKSVRVAMKDHSFFVPKNIVGKTVLVYGTLSEETISEDEARHYAEDAGKDEKEIATITGEQKEYTMVGETVLIP